MKKSAKLYLYGSMVLISSTVIAVAFAVMRNFIGLMVSLLVGGIVVSWLWYSAYESEVEEL